MRLDDFNAMPDPWPELTACCASPAWVAAVVAGRPYASVTAVVARADAALAGLDEAEVDLALAGHPRIGERSHHESSRREQSGVLGADRAVLDALATDNRAYEERFGHVYLVFANGRPAAELLQILRERLANDAATERRAVRAELRKINASRLERLFT